MNDCSSFSEAAPRTDEACTAPAPGARKTGQVELNARQRAESTNATRAGIGTVKWNSVHRASETRGAEMSGRTPEGETSSPSNVLGTSLELPCGVTLKNRLAKSAMSDSLGDGAGNPTEAQIRLYERWAEGGAAVSIIGEVQGDPRGPYPMPSRTLQATPYLQRRASPASLAASITAVARLWCSIHVRTAGEIHPETSRMRL